MGVVFRQSLKGTIVTFIGAGIGFLTTFFISTALLTPGQVGLTRVVLEAATFIGGLALLGTQSSVIRYYPHFRTSDGADKGFFGYVLLLPAVGFLFFGGLYLVLRPAIVDYFSKQNSSFGAYYLYVLPLMVFVMYQTVLEIYASVKHRVAYPKLIREVVLRLLVLGCYFVFAFANVSFGLFMGLFVVAYGIAAGLNLLYALRLNPNALVARMTPPPSSLQRDFVRYTSLMLVASLGSSIISRLDIFMVSGQMGFDYAGIYTIAFYMVAVIEMPSRSLTNISSPLAAIAVKEGNTCEVNRLFRRVSQSQLLIGGILFLILWINIDFIFELIPRSSTYSKGKWVVLLLGAARLVEVAFSFGNSIIRYSRHYPWAFVFTLLVTLLTVVLNYVFILRWGISGAALATLVASLLSYAFSQVVLWYTLRVTPIDSQFLKIFVVLLLSLGGNMLIPKIEPLFVDSLVRSSLILPPAIYLLSRLEAAQPFRREIKQLFAPKPSK